MPPVLAGAVRNIKNAVLEKLDVNSMEHLDELIQKGYFLAESDRPGQACSIWLEAWKILKPRFTPDIKSISDAEKVFSGRQSLYNWCQDLEMELGNAARDDSSFHEKRMAYCMEFCSFFPETDSLILHNMKRAVAEGYFGIGNPLKGDEAYQKLIEEYPENIWGYIGWGDMYFWPMNKNDIPDYEKAEKIYRKALGKDLENEEDLKERLSSLKRKKKSKKKKVWK